MHKRKGFTLIELLVVIAIIALLMCILMPALRQPKEQGKGIEYATILRIIWQFHWAVWLVLGLILIMWAMRRLRAFLADRVPVQKAWAIHEKSIEIIVDYGSQATSQKEWDEWRKLIVAVAENREEMMRSNSTFLAANSAFETEWEKHDEYLKLIIEYWKKARSQREEDKWEELVTTLCEYRRVLMCYDLEEARSLCCQMEGILAQIMYMHNWRFLIE